MVIEFFLLIVLLLVVVSAVTRHLRQVRARTEANEIINGEAPATAERINKCIDQLLATKNWLQDMTEADRQRVLRLRDMRKEMVTPHS
ncbi:unnamed protein product [marine sediment metagenome]|uniref:Uncharacterized protein n=1 Tax=marine sediment metagenome TaxID=412755 RepID=X1UB09_9ZZZZ